MIDNILFDSFILDIDQVNSGSLDHVLFQDIMSWFTLTVGQGEVSYTF